MVMNNLDGTTKTEMSFGTKNKNVHATIKFDADSFRVLNKDGSTASLHVAQGTDADSAVTMNYLENQLTRIESQQDKITSSDENNMVHYNDESGTLGVNNITADRIVGLQKNRVVITDENAQVTTSTVAKAQLLKLPNVPDDTNAELEKKADVDHSHLIADVEGLQDALDSKALSEHTHTVDDISGLDTLSVRNAEHAEEADSAKTDANGTPIGKYVRNVTISDNKITVTKGNGNIVTTEYIHNLVPATDTEDGKAGLVPAPCRADAGKFLSATGTWEKPAVSLADAGVTLTAEEINKIPEDIAAVDARVDEADQNLETAKADLEGKIDAQGSELHTAMGDLSTKVDTAVEDLNTKLEGKANAEHTHGFDEVTGLKQMTDNLVMADQEIKASIEEMETTVAGKAEAVHTHEITDVTGLQDALDEKALADHDHTIDQISDIANANVAKATVAVQDTTGKNISDYVYRISADGANLTVTKGNGSSINVPISAEGTYSEFEGATDSENGTFGLVPAPKAGDQNKVLSGAGTWVDAPPADLEAAGITATAEELNYMTGVTSGVQAQLDAKAAAVHTHEASEITDFAAAVQSAVADDLAGKADAEHTHEAADITDLTDTLSSAVVGEAGKATSDKNGKDITTYVADVTSDDTKITVTKGDGSSSEIQFPEETVYDAFTGASAEGAGEEGLVPAPAQGDQDKFLKADGTWAVPVDNDTTYDVATSETAGLVKASSEIQVDGEGVMTVSSIPQSKVTNLENTFATMSQASNKFEITDGLFEDTRVSYRDEEIRVMYSTLTPWAPQDEAEDPNTVTMALRAYAPADATGYRIALEDEITEGEVTAFGDPDSLGRNYVETRLPVATYDAGDSAWTYLGSSSTAGKYVGWYVTVEWYNAGNKIIGSETVRVNLATESTFNSNIPGYMGDYAKSTDVTSALEGKADTEHTHVVADITDLDLSNASVAEATKATQDANGKAITEYVADVTLQESTIKIAKGDGSSSEIHLPEGTAYSNFTGTDGSEAGAAGLVPAPQTTDANKYLKSDGTWATIETGSTVEIATGETAGIVKASSEIAVAGDGVMSITAVDKAKVTGLDTALAAKADTEHTHEAADITDLQGLLDAKANATHTHATSDVTGLDTALAGKAASVHTHAIADITDLNSAVVAEAGKTTNALSVTFNGGTQAENNVTFDGSAAKTLDITLAKIGAAAAEHTHETADVTGLDTALAGKADSVHTHEMASVTGLSEALEAKADSEHTHTVSQITDIANATVAAAGKATNDKNDKDITTYVADVTFAENKITVKKGDSSSSEIELPEGTVYSNFTGASAEGAGAAGLVPAPAQGDQDKFLKADGTWAVVEAGSDVAVATEETAGIVKASSEIAVAGDGVMSITAVSQDKVTGLTDALGGKAASVHTHAISDVTDLQTTLDNKLEASDLAVATDSTPGLVKASTEVTVAVDGALGIGTIEQAKVNGLTAALGAKADTEHTHTVSDITDLNLSAASVAEATKATTDKNSKDITTYVADVTKSEDNKKIVITKGDSSSTEIELPEAATYSAFTGASAEDAGSAGLVPGPVAGDQDKFLKADGTWAVPVDTNTTYAPATTEVAGIVRASTEITVDGEGIMTVGSLAQSKVEGLTDALSGKANATHSHTASDISDLAEATVKAATQDTSGNALTSYVKSLSVSGSKLTVTKGDETSDELDLPSGGTGVDDPFTGTDGDTPGTAGLVPAPAAADADKFLASDGTWKVVQGAGGEVSIKYTSQVPTTAAVGGINEGYTPPSGGIDILDLIYKLLHPYVAPELTATMLPRNGGTVGIATTQNITGVRVNLSNAHGNKIMSYQVYDVDSDFDSSVPLGELYSEDYENGFAEGAQTVTLNSPYQMTQASAHKYLTVRAMDLDGNESIVKTASFNFVETYYWGSAPAETVIDEAFVNGDEDKTTQASAKGSKVVSVNHDSQQFVYFCAPKSYGEITSVKDQNQFENISDFEKNKTEVTINGRDYYVYHNDTFMGEMTFTFSY